jgi:hypothetical protein
LKNLVLYCAVYHLPHSVFSVLPSFKISTVGWQMTLKYLLRVSKLYLFINLGNSENKSNCFVYLYYK